MEIKQQEPVTKDYLDVRLTELRSELRSELAAFRTEVRVGFEQLRTEIQRAQTDIFKWNMGMFAGLYGVVILGYFLK
jgi:hypothetical protein